jgi:hypothetical protein
LFYCECARIIHNNFFLRFEIHYRHAGGYSLKTSFESCDLTSMESRAKAALAGSSYANDQLVGIYPQVVSGMKYVVAMCAGTTPLTVEIYCPFSGACSLTPKVCKRPATNTNMPGGKTHTPTRHLVY